MKSTAYWNSGHNAEIPGILDLVSRHQWASTGTSNVVHRHPGQLESTSTRPSPPSRAGSVLCGCDTVWSQVFGFQANPQWLLTPTGLDYLHYPYHCISRRFYFQLIFNSLCQIQRLTVVCTTASFIYKPKVLHLVFPTLISTTLSLAFPVPVWRPEQWSSKSWCWLVWEQYAPLLSCLERNEAKWNEEAKLNPSQTTVLQKNTSEPQTVNIYNQQSIWIYVHADVEK